MAAPGGRAPLPEQLRRAAALVFVEDLEAPAAGPEDAHHLLHVLRLRPDEIVAAGDGQGRWRPCVLHTAGGRHDRGPLALAPAGAIATAPAGAPPVAVAFALQKGDRTDWTVQKLTECGVDVIVPLLSARTVVRLDEEARARRGERLRRIAREAAGQARRTTLPEVTDPLPLAAAVRRLEALGTPAFAEPGGGALGAARAVLVGPEGGWTPEELASAGHRVDLGPFVLRAETAALVAGVLLVNGRNPLTAGALRG